MFKSSLYATYSLFAALGATAYAQSAAQNTLRQTTLPVQPLVVRTNSQAPSAAKEIATQVPKARAILDAWQNTNPQRADRFIRLVYWNPADRESLPGYRERLSKIMLDIQNFYAFEMNRNGFGPISFKLEKEPDGLLKFYEARGNKPRSEYGRNSSDEPRNDARDALRKAGIDGSKETVLIFCNLVNWDAPTRTMTGAYPYNGGGTTASGSCVQVDSPALSLDGLTDTSEAGKVRNSEYGFITLARYNTIFIGGIAHELGHALSLPHDLERPDQAKWGKSLMGSGNRTYGEELRTDDIKESQGRGTFLPFADALRLASHPSFSGSIKGMGGKPNATVSKVTLSSDGKKLVYSAHVSANPPVYGVIGYFDPAGGQDYDARTATAIPDANGNFTLECDALVPGKSGELRVVTLQTNGAASSTASGNVTSPRYPYAVNADGTVDLRFWNTIQRLSPLLAAVKAQNLTAANGILKALEANKAPADMLEVARVQIATLSPMAKATPAKAIGNSLFLSEAQPTSAQVGWLSPTYNRLPSEEGNSPLLMSGGKIFARGIYAHAPAEHTYALGGQWNHFTGTAGVAQGQGGSVGFTVFADGKEVWARKSVKEGDLVPFDIMVQGVQTLKLQVDDGGDGSSSDWGLWLDPVLNR